MTAIKAATATAARNKQATQADSIEKLYKLRHHNGPIHIQQQVQDRPLRLHGVGRTLFGDIVFR